MSWLHLILVGLGGGLVSSTLPLTLELLVLSLAALWPVRRTVRARASEFRLVVVVPAHNEEKLIGTCVRSLLNTSGPDPVLSGVKVYVVAHNCTDQTAERARAAGAEVLLRNDEVGGKGVALDFGFGVAIAAGAQGVLVIDADSVVSANLTHAVASRLAAGDAAVQCRYEVQNAVATTRTKLAALALLGMNVVRPRGRERLGLSSGIFGNGFGLATATLQAVPYTANSLVEDLEYHLNLIRAGIRVRFMDEAAVFGEMPEGSAAASTQRARWEGGRILMRKTWAWPLAREVVSGRFSMLEPLLDLLSLPLATQVVGLAAAVIVGLAGHLRWAWTFGLAGLGIVMLYVLAAAALGPEPGQSLRALAAVPGYIVWKAWMIPKTRLAARRDAAWIRTGRNEQAGDEDERKENTRR